MMKTGQRGIDLIKKFEGYRAVAYICPAGVLTIGYGHTGGVSTEQKITEKQAEELLRMDVLSAEKAVGKMVESQITQSQFDSLVSFVFNCGSGNFQKSTLLKRVNANPKDFSGIRDALMMWNKAGGKVLPGLTKRRKEEADLYEE